MEDATKAADTTVADQTTDTTVTPPAEENTAANETAAPAPAPAEMKPTGPSGQTPEASVANNGPAPVGRVIVQKTIRELEDELDSGKFASLEDFVKAHWEAQDASALRLADVLRMDTTEVWDIVKRLGNKLVEGM